GYYSGWGAVYVGRAGGRVDQLDRDVARLVNRPGEEGKTWQFSGVFFRYPDGVSLPSFLNFGRDNRGVRDEYIYFYAYDASHGSRCPYTAITLGRVLTAHIRDRAAYEFSRAGVAPRPSGHGRSPAARPSSATPVAACSIRPPSTVRRSS